MAQMTEHEQQGAQMIHDGVGNDAQPLPQGAQQQSARLQAQVADLEEGLAAERSAKLESESAAAAYKSQLTEYARHVGDLKSKLATAQGEAATNQTDLAEARIAAHHYRLSYLKAEALLIGQSQLLTTLKNRSVRFHDRRLPS